MYLLQIHGKSEADHRDHDVAMADDHCDHRDHDVAVTDDHCDHRDHDVAVGDDHCVGTGYRRPGTEYRGWTFLLLFRAVYNPLWIMARVPLSPGALRGTGRRGRPGSQRVIISAAIGRR